MGPSNLARISEDGSTSQPEQSLLGSASKELQFRQYWQAWSAPSVVCLGIFQTIGWSIGLANVHRWVNTTPRRLSMHNARLLKRPFVQDVPLESKFLRCR